MNNIIEEILHLSKLQAKGVALNPEFFDIVELFNEIVEGFRSQPGFGTRLVFRPAAESIPVKLDKKQVSLVLTNLISNAFKYSKPGGKVLLDLMQEQDRVVFTVTDNGIGIPDDDLRHLFQPFYRASNAGNISGTGLGLNIVKESVNRQGGNVNVESKINKGTIFTVNFPITIQDENMTEP